jgi:hypothetical protein
MTDKDAKAVEPVVYIAGPMSGWPQYNYPTFWYAASRFRAHGFKVLNPAELPKLDDWSSYMREGIKMVAQASHIFLLEHWRRSRGARLEFALARNLGLGITERFPCRETPCRVCSAYFEKHSPKVSGSQCSVCDSELSPIEQLTKCYQCHSRDLLESSPLVYDFELSGKG